MEEVIFQLTSPYAKYWFGYMRLRMSGAGYTSLQDHSTQSAETLAVHSLISPNSREAIKRILRNVRTWQVLAEPVTILYTTLHTKFQRIRIGSLQDTI